MLGIGSCLGGEPRELSFLLGSEVHVNSHLRSSYEKPRLQASFKLRRQRHGQAIEYECGRFGRKPPADFFP
jgi:hypothetical protein